MNKKKAKIFLLSFCFMLLSVVAYSEKPPPTPGQKSAESPPPGPGLILPIDGGLSLLLVSGVVYGIYELRRKK